MKKKQKYLGGTVLLDQHSLDFISAQNKNSQIQDKQTFEFFLQESQQAGEKYFDISYDMRFGEDQEQDQSIFHEELNARCKFQKNFVPNTKTDSQISTGRNEQDEFGFTIQNKKSRSNLIKNFITKFVKSFRIEPRFKQRFMQIQQIPQKQRSKKFTKLVERLQKKLKQDNLKHTVQHLKSLLIYKETKNTKGKGKKNSKGEESPKLGEQDQQDYTILTRYLIQMCEDYTKSYHQVIKESRIIKVVWNLLQEIRH